MYWRHVLASTVSEDETSAGKAIVERGSIEAQDIGSHAYQQNHMGMIFRDNLSFSGFERNKLFVGKTGGFLDLSGVSGADSDGDCRAVLVADFDGDGDCDLFVNSIQRNIHHLFRNDLSRDGARNSIKIRLRATTGHADAIGAIVTMRSATGKQARVASCGGGFASQDAGEIIFGLGSAKRARFSVRWPGGSVEDFGALQVSADASNGSYLLVEGTGRPQAFESATFAFADPSPRGVKVKPQDPFSSLDLLTLDGATEKVEIPRDRRVLVNFWSTTCASCLAEMPELQRLHAEKKYYVISVSLDPAGRRGAIEACMKRFGIDFGVFRIDDRQAGELFDLSLLAIPVTFVLSADGRIDRIHQGRIKKGDL